MITLYMFIALTSSGEHIGTTDYVVYKNENLITLEVK